MFTKRIEKMTLGGQSTKVVIYSADDTLEMAQALEKMTPKKNSGHEYDLFNGTCWDEWSGAKSKEEAMSMIRHGSNNLKLTEQIKFFIEDVNNTAHVKKYRETEYRPFGCAVCVPRVLSGNPNCMVVPKKTKVKTRILRLAIDSGVSAGFSESDYRRVGSVVTRAIYDIEKAGFRVRLDAIDSTFHSGSNRTMMFMHVKIKDEREPMNLQRILFPTAEACYPRHLGFTLDNRAEEWMNGWSLGVMPSLSEKDEKKLYNFINGDHTVILSMQKLCNHIGKGTQEDVQRVAEYIFKKIEEEERI